MCKPGDQFILCTCESDEEIYERNHWTVSRFNKTKDEYMIGVWAGPYIPSSFDETYDWLLSELNSRVCFDKEMKCHEKDLLSIFINDENEMRQMSFGFEFRKGEWIKRSYDPFAFSRRHDEAETGIVEVK